jgi:uncharacterized protein YbaP (TraB family)
VYFGLSSDKLTNVINTRNPYWFSKILAPGKYFIAVTAIDIAGNESVKSNVVQIKIDKKWWRW